MIALGCVLFVINFSSSPIAATISYVEDETNFCNPDRGFFPTPGALKAPELINNRNSHGMTLVMDYYRLDTFKTYEILPQSVFDEVTRGAAEARRAGSKLIPRFVYTWGCTTPAEPPLARILSHIRQLAPTLQANSDVISHVQAGLIGLWGEWHHYDCTDPNRLDNTTARSQVLFELLDAIPNRNVAVRYPYAVMSIYGNSPIHPDSAFNGSRKSRTGGHNDSFRSGIEDRGTFNMNSIEAEKQFASLQNRYVVQSGETCGNSNRYSGCDSSIKDFQRMHWDAMCSGANSCAVIPDSWKSGGCYEIMQKKLGYRLKMVTASLQDEVRTGNQFTAIISIINVGWGKIFNPRGCELVFRNTATKSKLIMPCAVDPRRWCMTDSVVRVELKVNIPMTMPAGSYNVFLNLPDTARSIYHRPEYSIRLANQNVWEDSTGYNSLRHTVLVTPGTSVLMRPTHRDAVIDISAVRVFRRGPSIVCRLPPLNPAALSFELFSLAGELIARREMVENESGHYAIPLRTGRISQNVFVLRIRSNSLELGSFLLTND